MIEVSVCVAVGGVWKHLLVYFVIVLWNIYLSIVVFTVLLQASFFKT